MTVPIRILVVDDDRAFAQSQADLLRRQGYEVTCVYSESEARQCLAERAEEVDIALLDMRMDEGREAGLTLVKLIAERHPGIVSVVITGYGEIDNAVRCMEAGASNYITKGETPPQIVLQIVAKAADYQQRVRGIEASLRDATNMIAQLLTGMQNAREVFQRVSDELQSLIPKRAAG
jgi:two-component system, NtrC family, response regulator AtoC